MPKKGYVNLTIDENVEKILREKYEQKKQYYLEEHCITNFSGYLLFLAKMEERQAKEHTQK